MTDDIKEWAPVIIAVVAGSPAAFFAYLASRGSSRNALRKDEAEADRARDQAAFDQEGRMRDWQNADTTAAREAEARERASGLHWREVAMAWNSRAWSKLELIRSMRHTIINLMMVVSILWLWIRERDPLYADRVRPPWLRPDGTYDEPERIEDPPGLEDILK